ncbi:MAG: hypothetical protein ACTSQE_04085 [Candidatus Heimdallarchaeaceae archaeon]
MRFFVGSILLPLVKELLLIRHLAYCFIQQAKIIAKMLIDICD